MDIRRKISLIAILMLIFCVQHVSAQSVVLGTKLTSWLGGQYIFPHQLAIYDLQSGSIQVLIEASGGENFDAVSFKQNNSLVFSGRTSIYIAGNAFHPTHVGEFSWLSQSSAFFLTSAPNDVAAIHLLSDSQYLIAFKVATQFGGLNYAIGDVFHYDSQTDTATLYFSADNFFTTAEGGSYAGGNIDALAISSAGNLLLSTTNTAEIGTTAGNAVKVLQAGVYEYNLASGGVTEFFDPNLLQGSGVDLKAFALVPSPPPDIDGDGAHDYFDQCQSTPAGEPANADGCAPSQLDTDGDGVTDDIDQCPNTPASEAVDAQGCAWSQLDDDSDGVVNGKDYCLDSEPGEQVNLIGCPKEPYEIPAMPFIGYLAMFVAIVSAGYVSRSYK